MHGQLFPNSSHLELLALDLQNISMQANFVSCTVTIFIEQSDFISDTVPPDRRQAQSVASIALELFFQIVIAT